MFTSHDMTRAFGLWSKPGPLLIRYSSIYLFVDTLNLERYYFFLLLWMLNLTIHFIEWPGLYLPKGAEGIRLLF